MITRSQLLAELNRNPGKSNFPLNMERICAYAGAESYLLARSNMVVDDSYEFVLSSNWPFDLVRSAAVRLTTATGTQSELERCLSGSEPTFDETPKDLRLPLGIGRNYCSVPFSSGSARLLLLLLFREGIVICSDRLRDVALICSYQSGQIVEHSERPERALDLTEREVECLSWIAEGKTSDEISMIIGISKNTVNNYITSIMRKTSTKTRSEAIAFAVRGNLV